MVPQNSQLDTQFLPLISKHYRECVERRRLSPEWVAINCYSISANNASQYLGYTAKSDGIWLKGHNSQIQFKPDKPWKSGEDKKAPKYRSPLGEYDAMLPRHPVEAGYWEDIEALKEKAFKVGEHPCLLITEGFFKAIAGCSIGIPTIALLGVEMGLTPGSADPQGKRYLVPALERFAKAGFGFVIGFDADCATNKGVILAQRKLACQLMLFNVPVHTITGLWTPEEGKGMDDYIAKYGKGQFLREVMGQIVDITSWERQCSSLDKQDGEKTQKIPPADIVAHKIAEEYGDKLRYNNAIRAWMRYGADFDGKWSIETDEFIESVIGAIVDGLGFEGYGSHSYITNILKKLRLLLIDRTWEEKSPKELLPFTNGVLEVATGRLLPHSPDYRLTWQLPRPHNLAATDWQRIDRFLDHLTGGNTDMKNVLLCYCNAVLKGRSDLQKFLHLIGLGGTGKGTFARLVVDLVGAENLHSSTLEGWCGNRFESANAYRKRLVCFWDEDKQTGKLGKFLSLTGEDLICAEEKGKKGFQYRYDGMAMVLSNLPIFTGDAVSRVARRTITIPCSNPVLPNQKRNLNLEFQPELSAFTNFVLSLPDDYVTRILDGQQEIAVCSLEFWENRIRTDSIAAMANDLLIFDPLAQTPIGSNKDEGEHGTPTTLYGAYCLHAKQLGNSPKANKNFSPGLLELLRTVMGWAVERVVTRTGKFIKGVRLRTPEDHNIPTFDYQLMQRVSDQVAVCDGKCDGSESFVSKAFEESDSSIQTLLEKENLEKKENFEKLTLNLLEEVSLDSTPTLQQGFDPSPEAPSEPKPDPSPIEVGASVALADPYLVAYAYHGIVELVSENEVLVRWIERFGKPNELEAYSLAEIRLL